MPLLPAVIIAPGPRHSNENWNPVIKPSRLRDTTARDGGSADFAGSKNLPTARDGGSANNAGAIICQSHCGVDRLTPCMIDWIPTPVFTGVTFFRWNDELGAARATPRRSRR
ncbi:hypothetical protein [Candidatus Spongiihabitans sp.]|uniref:hypothetical protein n=1 Tax=Candidatus Spongiihabitans sp. TaxID=3101308 RepID=UPI003C7D6250